MKKIQKIVCFMLLIAAFSSCYPYRYGHDRGHGRDHDRGHGEHGGYSNNR
ncbi:hypothetical protein [Flavobacterium sp.]